MAGKTLICLDRDGTLIYDSREHLFLGRDESWRSKVKFLPRVMEGLKILAAIPHSVCYMITNQAGVAITDYPLLTLERAQEVCSYVLEELKNRGAEIKGYFLCPHATLEYVHSKPDVRFDPALVRECACLKPALGMVFEALEAENITPDNAGVYVIGDRASDVQTALNIQGTGILIPFKNEPGQEDKVKKLGRDPHIFIARDMVEAAEFIRGRERSS
ncbi:MAG: hypothetical protein HY787_04235 [Deltaproteobacteria bacterium]|nr:hypothetical protein [Deltaproteobacteria bacterium]